MPKRALAAALLLSIPVSLIWSQQAVQKDKPVDPVFKGDACLVYCLPGTPTEGESGAPRFRPVADAGRYHYTMRRGITLLHVSLKTHQAKALRTTGKEVHSEVDERTQVQERHTTYIETRCIGVMAAGDHLYVAVWQTATYEQWPSTSDRAPQVVTTCLMEVYDLATGESIGRAELNAKPEQGPKAALPAKAPDETPSRGVLSPADGGVSLFGAAFAVVDGKLKWSDAPKAVAPTTRQSEDAKK